MHRVKVPLYATEPVFGSGSIGIYMEKLAKHVLLISLQTTFFGHLNRACCHPVDQPSRFYTSGKSQYTWLRLQNQFMAHFLDLTIETLYKLY